MLAFTKVKTLLGHRGLAFSIECLESFVNNAAENIWLLIFEDGTLSSEDIKQIQSSLPHSTVIDKNECDAVVSNKLASFPACLQYRKTHVLARKLFDLILYKYEDILYIDSDIFFIKKFSLPKFTNIPVFMFDSENAYSFKPSEFLRINFFIFTRINSGFFFFPKEQFDLEYIELLLHNKIINKGYLRSSHWLEQTTWAFLASRHKTLHYFNPEEITMAAELLHITEQTICVHLVSTFRNHFEKVKEYARDIGTPTIAIPIQVVEARQSLKVYQFYAERIVKRIKRYSRKE